MANKFDYVPINILKCIADEGAGKERVNTPKSSDDNGRLVRLASYRNNI